VAYLFQLFSFKGRIRRSDFWLGNLILFIAMIVIAQGIALFAGVDLDSKTDLRATGAQFLAALIVMWPNLAVGVRRLHDRNQSGWWILLSFIPVIGSFWLVINLGILRGTEGDNRYGAEPERPQLTLIPRDTAAA